MTRAYFEGKVPIIKIAFLDVGQGDTVVISCSDTHEAIVVDCVDAKAVLNYLKHESIIKLHFKNHKCNLEHTPRGKHTILDISSQTI